MVVLCGHKWFEDFVDQVFGNSTAVVGDCEDHTVFIDSRSNRYDSAKWRCLGCVLKKIYEDLEEKGFVDVHFLVRHLCNVQRYDRAEVSAAKGNRAVDQVSHAARPVNGVPRPYKGAHCSK